jgi:hypothetical protein
MCSKTDWRTDYFLIYMLASVSKLTYRGSDHLEELVLPYCVQLVNLLVTGDTVLGQVIDKVLRRFRVLFGLHPCRFGSGMSIFLRILLTWFPLRFRLSGFWWKYVWCRKDLVEVLELLASLQSVLVWHKASIDLCNIGETVNNECADEDCAWHLIVFYS